MGTLARDAIVLLLSLGLTSACGTEEPSPPDDPLDSGRSSDGGGAGDAGAGLDGAIDGWRANLDSATDATGVDAGIFLEPGPRSVVYPADWTPGFTTTRPEDGERLFVTAQRRRDDLRRLLGQRRSRCERSATSEMHGDAFGPPRRAASA